MVQYKPAEMKKKVLIIFLLSITVLLFSQEAMICGDVNADTNADIIDALLIAQYYVGLDVAVSLTGADLDCTGYVDIIDALSDTQYRFSAE